MVLMDSDHRKKSSSDTYETEHFSAVITWSKILLILGPIFATGGLGIYLDVQRLISSDPIWYFIYPITYKHPKKNPKMIIDMATNKGPEGKRMQKPINRVTNYGKWKESGNRLKVRASDSKKEIGKKTRLYFVPSRAKNENSKKSKAKDQNSYQNKSLWVLYQYELIDVDPKENKYFLGKLMMNQSEPTNISSGKGETSQQLPSDYIENDHFPTENKYFLGKLMMNQSEPTNISSGKGETSQQLPSDYIENDHFPTENKYFLGKLMMNQSEPTNISSGKGETSQQLPSDYIENDHFPTEVRFIL
ncbi:hypothetical protein CRYUN_Cryun29cG0012400 [Craigia yunnanensis]